MVRLIRFRFSDLRLFTQSNGGKTVHYCLQNKHQWLTSLRVISFVLVLGTIAFSISFLLSSENVSNGLLAALVQIALSHCHKGKHRSGIVLLISACYSKTCMLGYWYCRQQLFIVNRSIYITRVNNNPTGSSLISFIKKNIESIIN